MPDQNDPDIKYNKKPLGDPVITPSNFSTGTQNDTASIASAEQTLESSTTAEVSSEYTHGTEFSWQEGLEIGNEWGVSVGPLEASQHMSVSMSASQAINESWSKGTSTSDTTSASSTVNVTLPAYTRVLLESSEAKETYTQSWNSPVALCFKVTIIDYSMHLDHNSDPGVEVIGSFPKGSIVNEPADAQRSLAYRFDRREFLKEPDMNFNAIVNKANSHDPSPSVPNQIQYLSTHIPCVSHVENLKTTFKTTSQRVSGLTALYPMTKIVSGNGMNEYNLDTDEYIYLDSIDVQGLNKKNADFYGFDSEKGSWKLVDQEGKTITHSDIAAIETNPVTGQQKLVAGKGEGTLYLEYMIDEDYYKDIYKASEITNDNIDTYKVPINVTNTELAGGRVDVSGEQKVVAGDPAVRPELTCKVRNALGREVSKPVHWYANDLNTLDVTHDTFRADRDLAGGTYPVVAYVGNDENNPKVKSAPYNVTVLEKRVLSEITLPKETKNFRPSTYAKPNFNVNDIPMEQFDQYHNTAFDGDFNPAYKVKSKLDSNKPVTWVCSDPSVKIKDNGNVFLPEVNGTFTFYAKAVNENGTEVISNPYTVTRDGYAEAMELEKQKLSYKGGDLKVKVTGPNLTDIKLVAEPQLKGDQAPMPKIWSDLFKPDKQGEVHGILSIPENKTDKDIRYLVKVSHYDGAVHQKPVAEFVVSVKPQSSFGGSGGGMILPEAPKATVTSSDKALNLTVNPVSQKVVNNAKQVIAKNPNLTLIGGVDESVNVKATKDNKAVLNFNPPVQVTLPVSDAALKSVKDTHKLTLAQVKTDAKGNTLLDFVGGKYDANAKVFRAKIDCAGDYILVEKADIVKLTMKIGDTRTTLNDAVKGIDAAPIIIDDRTMVPLRYIGESLGFKVDWDDATRTIKISQNDKVLTMTVDVEIPGFGAAPVIRNSRTFVPIRYISESFGARVLYDETVSEITVVK